MPFIRRVNSTLYRGASMAFGQLLIAVSWKKTGHWDRGEVLLVKNSSSSVPPVTGSVRPATGLPTPPGYQEDINCWRGRLPSGTTMDGDEGE